ncbi:MAG: hypothetical protein ACOCUV_01960, partial [bacterium]
MNNLKWIIFFFLFNLNLYSQDHPLNDAVYRNIIKYNMGVTDEQINDFIIIDNFITTLQLDKSTNYSLSEFSTFDLPSKNPETLIREYKLRKSEIEITCDNLRNDINSRLDHDIQQIIYFADKQLRKHGVNTSTGNKYADYLIREGIKEAGKEFILQQKEKQIQAAKREAERQLRSELRRELEPLRDKMLNENQEAMKQYIYAMAYCPSISDELYYRELYLFHRCLYNKTKSDFSIYSTDWLNPVCREPIHKNRNTGKGVDYLTITERKLKLYSEFNDEIFFTAANDYIEIAIRNSPDNANCYVLKSELVKDIID